MIWIHVQIEFSEINSGKIKWRQRYYLEKIDKK